MNTIKLENNNLSLELLDDFGAKIISIKDKKTDFEFVFQNELKEYKKPEYGSDFSIYDTSGIDECFPTIDDCVYRGIKLPDHGDIWSANWENIKDDNVIISKTSSKSLGFTFMRKISLEGDEIKLEYEVHNTSDQAMHYLWAHHGLLNIEKDTRIELPYSRHDALNVHNDLKYRFNITKIAEYPDNGAYKFYNNEALDRSEAAIYHPSLGLRYKLVFDFEKQPFFGVWLTKGGFKGDYNVALEPSNGFYDSLDRAVNNGLKPIEANEYDRWEIKIIIERMK
ncbi:hypothetical protein [Microaceticoccus formicicus]|uniref:aldose epimerase family protein n=1 Tax=Microaceticoccus formicicus TaxID=3118105 RepID=UPI003CD016BA|nr:hypothetical protein VZL98_10040 [Peptoniphilaceae bacterium AMB_02]